MKALVTGAAKGLGRALTEELLQRGYEVIAADVETERLEDLGIAHGGACSIRFADMSNTSSVLRLLDSVDGVKFDLVVLNAGVSATGKFEEIPTFAYDKLIDINLRAPIVLASSLVRLQAMVKGGKIVFVSSLSHAMGYPGASVYSASKDGLAQYAKSVRKPFKKAGVRVLTVFPGPMVTEQAEKHAPPGSSAEKRMAPEKMARIILAASRRRSRELYPGYRAYAAMLLGKTFPTLATRLMRKGIFDKLDGPVY